jgi:hypothetical protein
MLKKRERICHISGFGRSPNPEMWHSLSLPRVFPQPARRGEAPSGRGAHCAGQLDLCRVAAWIAPVLPDHCPRP